MVDMSECIFVSENDSNVALSVLYGCLGFTRSFIGFNMTLCVSVNTRREAWENYVFSKWNERHTNLHAYIHMSTTAGVFNVHTNNQLINQPTYLTHKHTYKHIFLRAR